MPFDVLALAQSGAAALVGIMATDMWTQIRTRVGTLLGRDDATRQQVLEELDETHTAVNEATDETTARIAQAELQGTLRTRLREDPELAAAFQALVDEITTHLPDTATTTLTQTAHADHGSTVIQAGRDVNTGSRPHPWGSTPRR